MCLTNKGKNSLLELQHVVEIEATQKTTFQIVPNIQYDYKSKKLEESSPQNH